MSDRYYGANDQAPLDYHSANSSAEIERRMQSRSIHPQEEMQNVGQSPAMPRALVDDPYAKKPEKRSRSRRNAEAPPQPADDRPEWMRVAQQNVLPNAFRSEARNDVRVMGMPQNRMKDQQAQTQVRYDPLGRPLREVQMPTRDQRAEGRTPEEDPYALAGYPPELRQEYLRQKQQQEAWERRSSHGAQSVAYRREQQKKQAPMQWRSIEGGQTQYRDPNQAAQSPTRKSPYPVYEAQEPEEPKEMTWVSRVPWLGIAAFAMVFVAIGLWLFQLTSAKELTDILAQKARLEQSILEKHPYQYRDIIETQAEINNLHPAFVAALVLNESSYRTDATSSVDARGLMQVMSETAKWIYDQRGDSYGFDFNRLYEAELNVTYGCWYLNYLSKLFHGDPVLVAASYHAGQNEVQNWLNDSRYSLDQRTIDLDNMIDGPTKQYATRVLNDYATYKRLYYENTEVLP